MSLELPYSVRVLSTEPLDEKYLNGTIPYTSVVQVNSILVAGIRSIGLTVNIANQEYWYKDNITDGGLILKTPNLANKADLVNGTVPASQLPSYVDDVIEVANLVALPPTGETGKIYVTIDTNKTYRWTGTVYVEISAGVSDHTLLTNIGTNTHAQIDTALNRLANTSGTNTGDQDLSNINNHITNTSNPHSVTKEQIGLSNVPNLSFSGSNTGDETTLSIQNKRPLKTIEGQNLEGTGNIDLTKNDVGLSNVDNTSDLNKPISITTRDLLTNGDEFYIDLNDILRLNISTYRQVEIATLVNQTFTLDFEPTFIISVIKDGIYLLQNQYIYTTPNQLKVLANVVGETIEITYEKFINEPTIL